MPTKTFSQWLVEVNAYCVAACGLGIDDLPDCCYADWYELGITPKIAAKRAIKNSME